MQLLHSGNSDLDDEMHHEPCYLWCQEIEPKVHTMLKRIYNAMITARMAQAATMSLEYLSDSDLKSLGETRATFVAKAVAQVQSDAAQNAQPVLNADCLQAA